MAKTKINFIGLLKYCDVIMIYFPLNSTCKYDVVISLFNDTLVQINS